MLIVPLPIDWVLDEKPPNSKVCAEAKDDTAIEASNADAID